jgi:hypothetical protein
VEPAELTVRVTYPDFAAWWEPYTLGVGPAGDYVATLSPAHVGALRARCAALLPAPIAINASAWTVLARA